MGSIVIFGNWKWGKCEWKKGLHHKNGLEKTGCCSGEEAEGSSLKWDYECMYKVVQIYFRFKASQL